MNSTQRKNLILEKLSQSTSPISASAFANEFSVSRQVIVGDIAVLRASGNDIMATPRGYVMQQPTSDSNGEYCGTLAVKHGNDRLEEELSTIVDYGGIVVDVTVEHPIYGQLVGALNIHSRYDVKLFMDKVDAGTSKPLSNLTGGIHLHKIQCKDAETFNRIKGQLKDKGILFE